MTKGRIKLLACIAGAAIIMIVALFVIRIPVAPLQVGFLYYDKPLENTAQYFEQPLIYNMEFTTLDSEIDIKFNKLDLIVVDGSLAGSPSFNEIAGKLSAYVENGGRIAMTDRSSSSRERSYPERLLLSNINPLTE